MKIPKDGSRWEGNPGELFHVLHTIDIENNTWVHYIKENTKEGETREYSCYLESFLARFKEVPK